jgi:hypothetical protein
MEDLEKILGILKHCISGECFGCYLRKSHQCERSMAFLANQAIVKLVKRIGELEKRNAELEARCAMLADQVSEEG